MRNLFYIVSVLYGTGVILVLLLMVIAGYDPESSADILLYFFWPILFPTLLLGFFSSLYPLWSKKKLKGRAKAVALFCQGSLVALVILLIYLVAF